MDYVHGCIYALWVQVPPDAYMDVGGTISRKNRYDYMDIGGREMQELLPRVESSSYRADKVEI